MSDFCVVEQRTSRRSHHFHLSKVYSGVDPQHLNRDPGTSVHPTPHVCGSTSPAWDHSNPLQFISHSIRGWQQPVFATHFPQCQREPLSMVATQARVLARTLVHVSWLQREKIILYSLVPGHLLSQQPPRSAMCTVTPARFWTLVRV